MKRRSRSIFAGISATLVTGALIVPAEVGATPSVTVSQEKSGTQECPSVQLVLVNSKNDSDLKAGSDTDAGFFSDVSKEALTANGDNAASKDAGFTGKSETSSEPSSSTPHPGWGTPSSSTPHPGWGTPSSSSTPTSTTSASAKAEKTSTPSSTSTASSTVGASPTSTESQESSTTSAKPTAKQKVARTYINFDADLLPGVGDEKKKDYAAAIDSAVEKTTGVLNEVHQKCPDTKAMLMGYAEGAQVANTVAKRIGAGEGSFPADKIAGVALFSDPSRSENQSLVANGATAPAAPPGSDGTNLAAVTDSLDSQHTPAGAGVATLTDQSGKNSGDFGTISDRTMSFCVDGDATCAIAEGSPLRKLIAAGSKNIDPNDPQRSLMAVADTLGPAVILGGVETLADDLSFGPQGFQLARAEKADDTLIGRIAAEAGQSHNGGEMGQRLTQAGMKLGGMALAAGATIAKEVVTPANLAEIAAAGAINPLAAIPVVVSKLATAATHLITPATATGVSQRVFDEAKAAGLEDQQLADVATQAATWKSIGEGAYTNTPVTSDGQSPTSLASQWTKAAAGAEPVANKQKNKSTGTANTRHEFDADSAAKAQSLIGG